MAPLHLPPLMGLATPLKKMGIRYTYTINSLQGNPFANRYVEILRYKFLLQKETLWHHQSRKKVIFLRLVNTIVFFCLFYCFCFFSIIAFLMFRAIGMISCLCFFLSLFSLAVPERELHFFVCFLLLFPTGNNTFSCVFFSCSLQGTTAIP